MYTTPEPDHMPESPATPAADLMRGAPPDPGPKPGWSWWWIFPALLALYLAYSAIPYLPFGKPKATADELLSQSLAAAQAGRYQECITAAREAIKLNPSSPEAYNNIGWCSAQMGNWNEGIQNATQALKLNPNMERARNNLLWMISKRDGKAPILSSPAAPPAVPATSPAPAAPPAADAAMQRSLASAQAHRYQECIEAAREALKLNPNYAEAYNNLGYCSGALGKFDEGVQYLNQALRIRPDFQLAKGNIAWIQTEKAKADKRARSN